MTRKLELTGEKFGRLTVIRRVESNRKGNTQWLCLCDCGNETVAVGYTLKNGNKKSCGCLQRERTGKAAMVHGMYGTRLHKTWQGMKARCDNPNEKVTQIMVVVEYSIATTGKTSNLSVIGLWQMDMLTN